mgnify:CR=1 FL=1
MLSTLMVFPVVGDGHTDRDADQRKPHWNTYDTVDAHDAHEYQDDDRRDFRYGVIEAVSYTHLTLPTSDLV